MRCAIIGDIHGCYEQMQQILNKINIDQLDRLIFLGDYIDRGPNSAEVFFKLKELKEEFKDKIIIIYGNHELMMQQYVDNISSSWKYNGCEATKESFYNNNIYFKDYLNFINTNSQLYYENDLFSCSHATPYDPNLDIHDFVWDRDVLSSGNYDGKLCFVGHTSVDFPVLSFRQPQVYEYDVDYELPSAGIIDIDTGCVYDGILTACVIEGNKMKFINNKE